jgi:hypothetical protein
VSSSSPHGKKFYKPQKARLPDPTPFSLMQVLRTQHFTRFSMALILVTCICLALLTTKLLLAVGVLDMWVRYLVALFVAYGTFFIGVWIWLHLSPYGRHLRSQRQREEDWVDANIDLPLPSGGSVDGGFQGGGGSFDGGGASGSWDAVNHGVSVDFPGSSSSVGNSLGDIASVGDVGDEGGCLLVIAGILLAIVLFAIFGATAYVVYQAPAILAEVVFEVLLGSPLARGANALGSANWPAALLAKTWKPFAIIAVMAIGFALFCKVYFPDVASIGELLSILNK